MVMEMINRLMGGRLEEQEAGSCEMGGKTGTRQDKKSGDRSRKWSDSKEK